MRSRFAAKSWLCGLLNAGWRPVDLDGIPGYSRRHRSRICSLLAAALGILALWVVAHQFLAPDIARKSLLYLGGWIIPQSLLILLGISRARPSLREYGVMFALASGYATLQYLFSIR